MTELQLIECVPNFSEGTDLKIIKKITDAIESVDGIMLLNVDPGKATNRTVVTFVGEPKAVIQAAFLGIKKASELIDMSKHSGEHPRMGATDVCPLIPISNISMKETSNYAKELGKMVGSELDVSVFLYENSATSVERKNLAIIREGEYEGMEEKLKTAEWKPDYGPTALHKHAGVTAIGARDFLVAYNVNLNTTSVKRAFAVALDIREKGRIKRKEGNPYGELLKDDEGNYIRVPGACKAVKAIGWYIDEYEIAQVSMNLTDLNKTPIHIAFEACRESATNRGMRVTGSEIIGLVPKKVLIDAGKYFLRKQERSVGISDAEIIHIAVKSMGLDDLAPFHYKERIIEYLLEDANAHPLIAKSLKEFSEETASESLAPGGGSISAYIGTLGIALGNMVANLSAVKKGWEDKWEYYSEVADKGKAIQEKLLYLVDEDTNAFNLIIDANRKAKTTKEEKRIRKMAISEATKNAINVPLNVMQTSYSAYEILQNMAENGNPNSSSDVGVGALSIHTAIEGAFLNVQINCSGFKDKDFVQNALAKGEIIVKESLGKKIDILKTVGEKI